MHVDAMAFALLGGAAMGSYPLFIRTQKVLEASPHPIVFQLYKSSWVFFTGLLFLIPRALAKREPGEPVYAFSWWAFISAALWIPSGLTTILTVPMIGMSLVMAISAATSASVSFFVFWLFEGSRFRSYQIDGDAIILAPLYLVLTLIGMVALIFSRDIAEKTRPCCCPGKSEAFQALNGPGAENKSADCEPGAGLINAGGTDEYDKSIGPSDRPSCWQISLAVVINVVGASFSAAQYAIVTLGKRAAMRKEGCESSPSDCSPRLKEQFNTLGSWMTTFGFGAITCTLGYVLMLWAWRACRRAAGTTVWDAAPNLHWPVLRYAGSGAGSLWCLGNFCIFLAVVKGGNAVSGPQSQAAMILSSGAWGLLYYGEVGGRQTRNLVVWLAAAAWTVASMTMLGLEKLG